MADSGLVTPYFSNLYQQGSMAQFTRLERWCFYFLVMLIFLFTVSQFVTFLVGTAKVTSRYLVLRLVMLGISIIGRRKY